MADPHDLQRFVAAQDAGGSYDAAVAELRGGRKRSHWMWFVFPQIAGLGQSPTSRRYAIRSLEEARAYLDHPVLGARLRESAGIVADLAGPTGPTGPTGHTGHTGRSAEDVFGGIDALKLRSSMTLFHRAAPDEPLFGRVLDEYFGGSPDPATDRLLADTT
jgi:uncharacterized protein (DUF1810 family)